MIHLKKYHNLKVKVNQNNHQKNPYKTLKYKYSIMIKNLNS